MSRFAIVAASLALVAIAALPHDSPGGGVRLVAAHGALAMLNSRPGAAILDVPRIAPGESATGTVTITNSGRAPAHLYLDSGRPTERRGPNGGSLVERLELTIAREGGERVARGTLASTAGCHDLGVAGRGEIRTYRFTVRMPDGGGPRTATSGDNAYAGSRAGVDEAWEELPRSGGCGHPIGAREVRGVSATHRAPGAAGPAAGAPGGSLPFTGFPVLALAGAGLAFAVLGGAMRRRARRPPA